MRPVHEAAKVIPFVPAAKPQAVAEADRYPFGQVDIVRDQERLTACYPQHESLVS